LPLSRALVLSIAILFTSGLVFAQDSAAPADQTETAPADTSAVPAADDSAAGDGAAAEAPEAAPSIEEAIPAPTLEEELEALNTQIAEAEELIAEAQAADPPGDGTAASARLEQLQSLKNVLQRRLSLQSRFQEVETALEEIETKRAAFREEGINGDPPYSLATLDGLRDERAVIQRENETDVLSLRAAEEALKRAESALANAQKARRDARDAAEALKDESQRDALSQQLRLAQIGERTAEQQLEAARTQRQLAARDVDLSKAQLELVNAQIAEVAGQIVFTEEAYQERLDDIESRRAEAEAALADVTRRRDRAEAQLYDGRQAANRAETDEQKAIRAEQVATQEAWFQTNSRAVEYLQERLTRLSEEQRLWERRLTLINTPEEADPDTWQSEAATLIEEIQGVRETIEARLNDLRSTQLDLQNRLNSTEPVVGAEFLRDRIKALEQREVYARDYLASLVSLERLSTRLNEQLKERVSLLAVEAQWERMQERALEIWAYELFVLDDRGFTVGRLVMALIIFLVVLMLEYFARWLIRRILTKRLSNYYEQGATLIRLAVYVLIKETRRYTFIVFALYCGLKSLPFSERIDNFLDGFMTIVVLIQIAIWATSLLVRSIERTKAKRKKEDPSSVSAFGLIAFFGRIAIWAVVLLTALHNLGFNITTFVAGLGVGGIAVAFALQNILADVFNSVAILLDKPFVVGDFIMVDDQIGTVENIGIKTTRVRSISGEQIVISNTDLLGSRIRNFKRMFERRVVFNIGVVYETPPEKLEMIGGMIREIIEGIEKARFDRSHFNAYGDFALNIETVYFVLEPDYTLYMDIQQKINLEIYRRFEAMGIVFAYPTQELIVRPTAQPKPEAAKQELVEKEE
jgi:small-conductance mechanosensitive channel